LSAASASSRDSFQQLPTSKQCSKLSSGTFAIQLHTAACDTINGQFGYSMSRLSLQPS
jgi:hypothetical protein